MPVFLCFCLSLLSGAYSLQVVVIEGLYLARWSVDHLRVHLELYPKYRQGLEHCLYFFSAPLSSANFVHCQVWTEVLFATNLGQLAGVTRFVYTLNRIDKLAEFQISFRITCFTYLSILKIDKLENQIWKPNLPFEFNHAQNNRQKSESSVQIVFGIHPIKFTIQNMMVQNILDRLQTSSVNSDRS
ncbi:Hypothetical_protein [Hexamita inflata]|uniref:Hypothetical_protein n=1 Tax=Hexamita inflata TaxID=28002 RepID=A0AA86RD17_9EUKA|nr:Hypothetical protein HINF_LOCUS61752 [Hexamita inflata]